MSKVYFDQTANRMHINRGRSIISIPLPKDLKPGEVYHVIGSKSMQEINKALRTK